MSTAEQGHLRQRAELVCALLTGGLSPTRSDLERVVHRLGYFDQTEDAARAHNQAAAKLHGEFANLGAVQ